MFLWRLIAWKRVQTMPLRVHDRKLGAGGAHGENVGGVRAYTLAVRG